MDGWMDGWVSGNRTKNAFQLVGFGFRETIASKKLGLALRLAPHHWWASCCLLNRAGCFRYRELWAVGRVSWRAVALSPSSPHHRLTIYGLVPSTPYAFIVFARDFAMTSPPSTSGSGDVIELASAVVNATTQSELLMICEVLRAN